MPKLILVTLLAIASFPLAAQQPSQPPRPSNNDKAAQGAPGKEKAATAQDEALRERIRVEGAAGGTAPVPPEKRKAVGAGAGPHIHDTAPSPSKLPRDRPVLPTE
jgi:hypothetical protein